MKKNNRYNALNKERKKANLTFGMIRLLVICLVVPFGALSVVLFFSSASKTSNQVRNTVVTSMENAAENCNSNIEKVIQESKQASYDNVIRTSYLQFLEDKNEAVMYREISSYQRDNSNEYHKRANFPENIEFSGISLYSDKSIRHHKNTRNFNGN